MKTPHLLAQGAAAAALLILAAAGADAQQRFVKGGWGNPPRAGGGMHGRHGSFVPLFIGEREVVVVEREVVREVPAAPPPPPEPPAPPRKPYVIGASYSSLPPNGCMKMIEAGGAYFYCSGEWYRQQGRQYQAVAQP